MFHVEHRTIQENDRKQNAMRSTRRLAAAAAALTVTALTTLGAATGQPATATPTGHRPAPVSTVTPAPLIGDDDFDGVIREEESGWRCDLHANKRCGKRALMAVKSCAYARALVGGRIIRLATVPPVLMPACIKLGERNDGPVLVTWCRTWAANPSKLTICLRRP